MADIDKMANIYNIVEIKPGITLDQCHNYVLKCFREHQVQLYCRVYCISPFYALYLCLPLCALLEDFCACRLLGDKHVFLELWNYALPKNKANLTQSIGCHESR